MRKLTLAEESLCLLALPLIADVPGHQLPRSRWVFLSLDGCGGKEHRRVTDDELCCELSEIGGQIPERVERVVGESWVTSAPGRNAERNHVCRVTEGEIADMIRDHTERVPKVQFQPSIRANVLARRESAARTAPRFLSPESEAVRVKNRVEDRPPRAKYLERLNHELVWSGLESMTGLASDFRVG